MAEMFDSAKTRILEKVQVNIPFTWLMDPQQNWLEIFTENRIQPEIGLDAESLDRFAADDFSRAGRWFADAGCRITVHGPFLDLSPGSPDPEIRSVTHKRLTKARAVAEALCPKTMVCHAGYDPARYSFIRQEWYKRAADTWNRHGRGLWEKGIRLVLENVYEPDPGDLADMFEKTDPETTGFCLDVGHLNVFSSFSLSEWLKRLGPRIRQLHLHDNCGKTDDHLGMGQGIIDFTPLHEWLKTAGPGPVITLEPHRREDLLHSLLFLENHKWFQ
ncbi:MAG: sugar phosphate isomerase/epimerase family protein [Desulfosalsimonas sp.]|uniref:sugar phosphate isomerase/epimerase family protein n=1 Tax=Desulfosalsimonas sp. TaxID=3073848 RepID=UPI003970CE90